MFVLSFSWIKTDCYLRASKVRPPATHKPTDAEFFKRNGQGDPIPNADYLKKHFFREGRVFEQHALWIVRAATEIMKTEQNMVSVSSPVTGALFVEVLAFGLRLIAHA